MNDYKEKNFPIRLLLIFAFSYLYILAIYNHTLLSPFKLESDYFQYYELYNSIDYNHDRFGTEIITPLIFNFSKEIGLNYYQFNLIFGFIWLAPIIYLSNKIKTIYLTLFLSSFFFYFINNYAFLFRQYLAFLFFIPFVFSHTRKRWLFFVISILTHLSSLFFLFFSWLQFKKRIIYFIICFISIFIMILNFNGYGFSKTLTDLIPYTHLISPDLQRKLSLLLRLENNVDPGGWKISLLLSITILLHSIFITDDKEKFSILRAFFFSAIAALIFSDFKILSNRLGFIAYYFSIPYFFLVLSNIKIKKSKFKNRIQLKIKPS